MNESHVTFLNDSTICLEKEDTLFQEYKQKEPCLLERQMVDSFEIYAPTNRMLPYKTITADKQLPSYMIFTTIFLILFAFIRLRGKDILSNILYTIVKRKKASTIISEGIFQNLICFTLGLIMSFSCLAIFINYLFTKELLTVYTLYIFLGLVTYHILTLIIVRYLGWTFNAKAVSKEFMINIWVFNISIGLISSPLIISLFFIHGYVLVSLVKSIIMIITILMIIKIIRWLIIFLSYRVSILYMILYLCALELVPLFTLYKFIA